MSWLDKLIGRKATQETILQEKKQAPRPAHNEELLPGLNGLRIGRYNDNNKTYGKAQCWYKAEDLFKEKKYFESFFAFFDYLRDEDEDNVHFQQEGNTFRFSLVQGSKVIHCRCDGQTILACAPLAAMQQTSVAVMRRLLEMNYTLYYCRAGIDDDSNLCLLFDTDIRSASPEKLYAALRELAAKADRQDDMLLSDFSTLKPAGTEHIRPLGGEELEIKYRYFRKWIDNTLREVDKLNQDSFSGAIAYLLLALVYRIDFLIVPEAKLLNDLEKISNIYWEKKEDKPLVERNRMMKEAIAKLRDMTKEEFAANVYHTRGTFGISGTPKFDKIKEHVYNANKDSAWYIDNQYPHIALALTEYGVLYNHYIYSMPKVLTDLATIYMAVLHGDYFSELGMHRMLYDNVEKTFDRETISGAAKFVTDHWQRRYPDMRWNNSKISYDSLYDFGITFSELMVNLNLDTRR